MGTEEAERPILLLAGPCFPQNWDGVWGTKQRSLPQDAAAWVGAEGEVEAAHGAGNQALNRRVKLGHSTCHAYDPSVCQCLGEGVGRLSSCTKLS